MGSSNYVHVDVDEIVRVTDKALLVRIDDEQIWLPLSQIADAGDYDFQAGDQELSLSVTEWIAREKGLEE